MCAALDPDGVSGSYRVKQGQERDEFVVSSRIGSGSRFGGFAVTDLPGEMDLVTLPVIAGELCAALDAGMPGLIVDMPGPGSLDSARLDALMRAARRARGWGSWLRLVIPDPDARKMVRLVALDEVMPVHASVTEAIAAARREAAAAAEAGR